MNNLNIPRLKEVSGDNQNTENTITPNAPEQVAPPIMAEAPTPALKEGEIPLPPHVGKRNIEDGYMPPSNDRVNTTPIENNIPAANLRELVVAGVIGKDPSGLMGLYEATEEIANSQAE